MESGDEDDGRGKKKKEQTNDDDGGLGVLHRCKLSRSGCVSSKVHVSISETMNDCIKNYDKNWGGNNGFMF